jgi:quinol monooxygenase YgiN
MTRQIVKVENKLFNSFFSIFHQAQLLSTFCCALILFSPTISSAQNKNQMVRLAKIKIDSAQLEKYKAALKEGIETAVRVEPGVITLFAVYDKNDPTNVTVLEVYADVAAYKAHIETPHFKKYKSITKDMVKSLELVDVDPIAFATKPKQK